MRSRGVIVSDKLSKLLGMHGGLVRYKDALAAFRKGAVDDLTT